MVEIRKALEIDPLSPIINVNVGDSLYYFGNPAGSIEYYQRAREISPGFGPSYFSEMQPLCYLKRFDDVMEDLDEYAKVSKPGYVKLCRAYANAHNGNGDAARRALEELESEKSDTVVSIYFMALAYFVMGDNDRGFELLERAYQNGEHEVLNLQIERELNNVRSDSRYISMLEKSRIYLGRSPEENCSIHVSAHDPTK